AVEAGAFRVHQRGHQESRCAAVTGSGRVATQVAAHRDTLRVPRTDQVRSVRLGKVEPAEEAHLDARARGRIHLPPHHRVEQRGTGVAGRPDGGIATGQVVPAKAAFARAEVLW